jgi:hypothetical protein
MSYILDIELQKRVDDLKSSIEAWLIELNLNYDCGFKSWVEHFNDEPGPIPCVLVLCHENALNHSYELMEELCVEVIGKLGYFAEPWDSCTLCIYLDDDSELQAAFQNREEWTWLLQLIEDSYFDLNSEIFEYTAKYPDKLVEMSPRAFEKYLDAIFRNNGYRTLLGPGRSDGGVDLRLYNNDVVGEIVTLVQAKRYAAHCPIGLEAVQALSAIVDDEQANRGLFVTTSRYLPSTRNFSDRKKNKILLADRDQVTRWAHEAAKSIERDKSRWVSKDSIYLRLEEARLSGGTKGIYVSHNHFSNTTTHKYALLLQAIGGVALMLSIPSVSVSGDRMQGTDIPNLKNDIASKVTKETIFRVRQLSYKGEPYYWGDHRSWHQYDGKPIYYDHFD